MNSSTSRSLLFLALAPLFLLFPQAAAQWPGAEWEKAAPAEFGLDAEKLKEARDYALMGEGSGLVIYNGKAVIQWGDPKRKYDLKSTTKSFGSAALGLAIMEGKVNLLDRAVRHHPSFGTPPEANERTGWLDGVTLFQLAAQTAGFEKPGGYTPLLFEPGTMWDYSDSGPNWLAECLTLAYGRDLNEVLFEKIFTPIGIERSDLRWRKNAYRPDLIDGVKRREFGSGIHANVEAMARFGYLHLRWGEWDDRQILPSNYVALASSPLASSSKLPVRNPAEYGRASEHYGLLWWNNGDGTLENVPRDAYWSWGLHDSLIFVVPSLDLVAARAGRSWKREKGADHYAVLRGFFEPLVAAVPARERAQRKAPYPPSEVIAKIEWAPADSVIRLAKGSDNWPLTWADDGALYTAYGDGRGFKPFVPEKLSLGIAKVLGNPPNIEGKNIESNIQEKGGGESGRKASGILMVDGTLYIWLRNAGNSRLAWSGDHGRTWEEAGWKFTTSFGYPVFLNFGRNYEGARDGYVYIYSHDSDSAYEPADQMLLARVAKERLRERDAYEFFTGVGDDEKPEWSSQIAQREAVFQNPGECYRSGISYSPVLERYLWCQILPGENPAFKTGRQDTRFEGGFGIYEAPEPWGPWRTAFFTEEWDMGPGETSSLPVKWMNANGTEVHLVFSGDDSFSVRKGRIKLWRGGPAARD